MFLLAKPLNASVFTELVEGLILIDLKMLTDLLQIHVPGTVRVIFYAFHCRNLNIYIYILTIYTAK